VLIVISLLLAGDLEEDSFVRLIQGVRGKRRLGFLEDSKRIVGLQSWRYWGVPKRWKVSIAYS